ncbi:MAG TPA: hypothetical protein VFB72_06415 [Verrucomicrobiae bacterium]|nr:hypothetical protein [Verrucomicrobiae bacterium]
MKKASKRMVTALACALVLCGCIEQNETVYHNPDRVKVEFENETAARIFYETLSKYPGPANKRESNTSVEIPVIFEHHSKVVEGENVAFNEAVHQCDSNQDGKITELEAKIFAEAREHGKY